MRHVFIGGAWPYANGSLHLGRVSSVLPGDVLARYFRAKGDRVLYVSGSDCHGTPIAVQAAREGIQPGQVADRYHREFTDHFQQLGFSYDWYTRTDDAFHHEFVQELFIKLLNHGCLDRKTVEQAYCETDNRFLPDRYVEGLCPICGSRARGDQCDSCSSLLDPLQLLEPECKLCGHRPVVRPTEHYFLALSRFQERLEVYARTSLGWRDNALRITRRYLQEGMLDRAATRDLEWGIDVPLEGFEGKKIYVWIEAVSGYLSASVQWAKETGGGSWEPFWSPGNENVRAYYVHGKDNVPFHTLIWPAILAGAGNLRLPDVILSSEYMTLEGRKFSTSNNWAVWVPDVLERYDPDSIRYFLIANGPEKRDTDFSWREFIYSHNGELLGAFGNFVNRTLAFIAKSFDSLVPGTVDVQHRYEEEWIQTIEGLYESAGQLIEAGRFKEALEEIFASVRAANKYFDNRKPWDSFRTNREDCEAVLYVCAQWIANFSNLLEPFIPFACARIRGFLELGSPVWKRISVEPGSLVREVSHLFQRIDPARIQEEVERMGKA